MMDECDKVSGDSPETSKRDNTEPSGSSAKLPQEPHLSRTSLKRHLRKTYGQRLLERVKRYFRCMLDHAAYASNAVFLMRCRAMRILPRDYRVECRDIKNTNHVVRILDECSYRLMLADLHYNKLRKAQVSSLMDRLLKKLEKNLSPEDLSSVVGLAKAKYENVFDATSYRQNSMFDELLKEYGIDQKKKGVKKE
ncbi:uncharacterized protein LOC144160574 [Haemaphysalis longicornis]